MKPILVIKIFTVFFFISFYSSAQSEYSVYLIGDAGEDTVPGKALLMLQDELLKNSNSAVIFLGDNIYPSGLKKDDYYSAKHLESQLSILNNYKGQAYFIPGNHDWDSQKANGWKRIRNQENYVTEYLKTKSSVANKDKASFLPADGFPGPTSVMLNTDLRLITIDTQWFLQRHKKHKISTYKNSENLFFNQLEKLLKEAKQNKEQVIIAAHHPMFTNGQHSKNKQPLRFLVNRTPLCFIGFMGIYRLFSQDIAQPRYKKMRTKMLRILNQYDNIIYASGHEHNLQFFKENNNKYIISGCGSKLSKLQSNKKFDSVFQDDSKTGFVKINYVPIGRHTTTIYRVGEEPKILNGF